MLKISLLGQFDVRQDGRPVDIPARPAKLLLCYLVLHAGKGIPRSQLGGILWPESMESTARKNLRNTVWLLRKSVGEEYIHADRETVAFNSSAPHGLDIRLLANEERRSDPETLIEIVSAYKGELLPGFYEDWVLLEREKQRSLFEGRMQELLDQLIELRRWAEVITWAEKWISQGLVPEPAYRSLMVAHAGMGDLAGMATAYQRCVKALNEELGVQPSAETETLYQELSTRRTPESKNIPAHPTRIIIQEELLAIGGQGEVYRGYDKSTGQAVVIKQLRPDLVAGDSESVDRFLREGEALRQLNHPNIVKMLDFLEEGGQYRIVMEYMPGGTLQDLLDESPQLPLDRVLDISLELADALSRAHHLGIIHRDVKPGNVLLASDGTPRLTDFGLARLEKEDKKLTQVGATLGSPAYMSPEALNGLDLDSRSDIWSFGILLYELLAGRHPYEGAQFAALIKDILTVPIPDINRFRSDLPPALTDLLGRMLVKEREDRLASMRLVAAELEMIRSGKRIVMKPDEQDEVLRDRSIRRTPTLQKLPIPDTPFIGRETEMADLQRLLIDGLANRLITLVGPGGIGKSRLALEAAAAAADDFPDGVYFIPLAPLKDPEHLVTTIAESIELRFYTSGDPRQLLIDYLSRKDMLLVMDNFEHILASAELVADILRASKRVKVLVTSRERLHLSNEAIYTVGGLRYPEDKMIDDELVPRGLAEYGAIKLLANQRSLARPDEVADEDELVEMARLCRLVQGMPLAIILAAGWLDMLSIKEVTDEIIHSLDLLESQMMDIPERQRSVRAVFDRSWSMLSSADQLAFSQLAIFRGGFTRKAALAVTGANLKTLRTLVDKSLIVRSRPDRYEIHELIRQYAEEKLEASDIAYITRDAHMAYYLNEVARREAGLKGQRQMDSLEDIADDLENVRAAWNWAISRQSLESINESLESLSLFFEMRSRQREGFDYFVRAREQLILEESDLLLGRLLARQTFFMSRFVIGDESGIMNLEQSLSIAENHDSREDIAFVLLAFGYYHAFVLSNNLEIALEYFMKCYPIYRELGDQYYCAKALHRIGYCYGNIGKSHDRYIEFTQRSMELAREIGDKFDLSVALSNLGYGTFATGDYAAGKSYLRESLVLAEELGDKISFAHTTILDSIFRFLYGNLEEAKLLAEKGLSLARELNFSVTTAYSLAVIGLCEAIIGDSEKAMGLAVRSEKFPSNPLGIFLAKWARSIANCGLGKMEEARDNAIENLKTAMDNNWLAMITWLLPIFVIISARENHEFEAVSYLALAESHPMSIKGWVEKWDIYTKVRIDLSRKLNSNRYQEAWDRGLELDLEEMAAELIGSIIL